MDNDPDIRLTSVPGRIMVIDDDPLTLKNLKRILEKAGHRVSTYSRPLGALKRLEEEIFDLIVSDIRMPEIDGITFLHHAKRIDAGVEVILITGYASFDDAVNATKKGSYHYLVKPFTPQQILDAVDRALKDKFLAKQAGLADIRRCPGSGAPAIIGKSPKIMRVEEIIAQIAPTECNVLITGESGTGKELAARSIHFLSNRAKGPFVAFNCGSFSEELIANELFGHEKEAYTGAGSLRPGLLETANTGTVFFDEIGDMPLSMQSKLLRVVQERELIRVGGTRAIALDVRIVAATSKDLKAEVASGVFRQDLYFRINVVNIVMPPLTERKADIPLLACHILQKACLRTGRKIRYISGDALSLLENYAYPGNVRELENILERAAALCKGQCITVQDLPADLVELNLHSYHKPGDNFLKLDALEKEYISAVLRKTRGSRTRAADILGIERTSLWRKIKKYGL